MQEEPSVSLWNVSELRVPSCGRCVIEDFVPYAGNHVTGRALVSAGRQYRELEVPNQVIGRGDGWNLLDHIPVDHDQTHVGILEFDLILFDVLDLDGMNAVVPSHLLVGLGRLVDNLAFGLGEHAGRPQDRDRLDLMMLEEMRNMEIITVPVDYR